MFWIINTVSPISNIPIWLQRSSNPSSALPPLPFWPSLLLLHSPHPPILPLYVYHHYNHGWDGALQSSHDAADHPRHAGPPVFGFIENLTSQTVQTVWLITTGQTAAHWTVVGLAGRYQYIASRDVSHIEYPNRLSVINLTKLTTEALILDRFQSTYVSCQINQP